MKRIAVAIAASIALFAGQAGAAERVTFLQLSPSPGQPVGESCQLTFDLSRDRPDSDGVDTMSGAVGVLLAREGARIGVLKVTAGKNKRRSAPDAASFVDGVTTTESELVARRAGDSVEYRIQGFVGKETGRVLDALQTSGKVRFAVRMPDAESSIWTLDISADSVTRKAWDACLSAMKPKGS